MNLQAPPASRWGGARFLSYMKPTEVYPTPRLSPLGYPCGRGEWGDRTVE